MIHYHGTPCGGPRQDVARFLAGRHALIPFSRPEDLGTALEVCQSVCLDNGAFTAWKSGKPVTDWGPYYGWVKDLKRHPAFDWAIIPDVIDGTERDNNRLLAEWPHEKTVGVPVWHMHEDIERLKVLAHEWPRIAIGSSGEYANPGDWKWWNRISEALPEICCNGGYPICRIHGLRMLDPAIFSRLPLSSADSTNAVRNSSGLERFGIYTPPTAAARMAVIADRIESHQSAAMWVPRERQRVLAFV